MRAGAAISGANEPLLPVLSPVVGSVICYTAGRCLLRFDETGVDRPQVASVDPTEERGVTGVGPDDCVVPRCGKRMEVEKSVALRSERSRAAAYGTAISTGSLGTGLSVSLVIVGGRSWVQPPSRDMSGMGAISRDLGILVRHRATESGCRLPGGRVMRHWPGAGVLHRLTRHNQGPSRKANSSPSGRNRPSGMSNGVTLARASSFCRRGAAWRGQDLGVIRPDGRPIVKPVRRCCKVHPIRHRPSDQPPGSPSAAGGARRLVPSSPYGKRGAGRREPHWSPEKAPAKWYDTGENRSGPASSRTRRPFRGQLIE